MPMIPASCFRKRIDDEGKFVVDIHCTACGEVATVSTAHVQLPLCVHNPATCPLALAQFFPIESRAEG
jgi:RNase P subunit RPR2